MPIQTINLAEKKYEKYLNNFTSQNWTMCVGAGICKNILPDWFDLTNNLVNKCFGTNWDRNDFKIKYDEIGFSLDSWIQGCFNKLISKGKTIQDFNLLLEQELYGELLQNAEKSRLKDDLINMFESTKTIKKKKVYALCDFFENNYSSTTLMQIVEALTEADNSHKLPANIITFNADSLLFSLLTIFNIKKISLKSGKYHLPKELYKKVTRTFQHWSNCIPIFHLHGSISPHSKKFSKNHDSRDSLIFLENSYNNVANNMYTWAQTSFLHLAQTTKMVFIGLSMSDPNIRRWLSWTNRVYLNELDIAKGFKDISLPHLWIKTRLKDIESQNFIDVSLRHMGVKVALIKNWSEVGKTLLNIM